MLKLFRYFRSIGYIRVTAETGAVLRINARAILRYEPFRNEFAPNSKTRIWYLDGHSENIRETVSEVDKQIGGSSAIPIPCTLKDRAFAALVKNQDDWQIDCYQAHHKPSGITYWTANGLMFFHADGRSNVSIGFKNRLKLWFWIKDVKREKVINSVNVPAPTDVK